MSGLTFFRLLASVNVRIMRRNILALREKSRLMVSVIALFVVGYWFAGYSIFHMGFLRLAEVPVLQVIVLDRMLYLFFAFLFLMLIFSNMIIGYSTLFKSQETQWMLTLPVRSLDVFRWKLLETTLLASWAFLFLSAPLIVAYGRASALIPGISPWRSLGSDGAGGRRRRRFSATRPSRSSLGARLRRRLPQ